MLHVMWHMVLRTYEVDGSVQSLVLQAFDWLRVCVSCLNPNHDGSETNHVLAEAVGNAAQEQDD